MKQYRFIIGIDPGVNTGLSIWNPQTQLFVEVTCVPIHKALEKVFYTNHLNTIFVRVEDARLRKWYGKVGREVLQGVGSVKRDCKIWEDFLKDMNIDHEFAHPLKGGTKWTAEQFKKYTGWSGQTNEHGRDSALLVYKFKK